MRTDTESANLIGFDATEIVEPRRTRPRKLNADEKQIASKIEKPPANVSFEALRTDKAEPSSTESSVDSCVSNRTFLQMSEHVDPNFEYVLRENVDPTFTLSSTENFDPKRDVDLKDRDEANCVSY
jgi:hypothetical protein